MPSSKTGLQKLVEFSLLIGVVSWLFTVVVSVIRETEAKVQKLDVEQGRHDERLKALEGAIHERPDVR